MQFSHPLTKTLARYVTVFSLIIFYAISIMGQTDAAPLKGKEIYDQIKAFSLSGSSAEVSGLVLKRDRVTMTFTGTFYFAAPVSGRVTGAVFKGTGGVHADAPPSDFEKANMKRLLDAETLDSAFTTVVLRFTDDTFDIIGANKKDGQPYPEAQKLAVEEEDRFIRETGANLSSRLVLSIVNNEKPGFFFANFDGAKKGRFSYVFDPQTRIPTSFFSINAGEKGLIIWHEFVHNEVWMAFYSLEDYQSGKVTYSDVNDLVDISHYKINVDLLTPKINSVSLLL